MLWALVWVQLSNPIPGRMMVSGSFGEIRGLQSIHLGIDIPVGEKIGVVPVLAAGNGYVYRIRVSHTGYGKAIYVRHPQGLVTVYGHLSHFAPKGEAIVEALQQAQRRFEVEKYLSPEEWPVKAGDILGWAGNSGYSFGPHLHFEVRTLKDETLPPLRYLPPLPDSFPPVFFRVGLHPLEAKSHVQGRGERVFLTLRQKSLQAGLRLYVCPETVRVGGKVGFLYTAADRTGGGSAWLGLRSISLRDTSDNALYAAQWETLDYDWRRFLRWHLDYVYHQIYRIGVGRLYEAMLALPWSRGRGVIEVPHGQVARYIIRAEDFSGNRTEVHVTLLGDTAVKSILRRPTDPKSLWSIEEGYLLTRKPLVTSGGDTVLPDAPLHLQGRIIDSLFFLDGQRLPTYLRACLSPGTDQTLPIAPNCTLRVHRETLHDTLYVRVEPVESVFGKGYLIGDPFIPVRFPAELIWTVPAGIRLEKSYPIFRPWYEEVWSPVRGATRAGGVWRIPVRNWGAYLIMEDTTAPRIRPLKPAGPFYLVSVEDLGSGVNPYSFRIQSERGAVLPEYYEPQRILYLPQKAGRRFIIEVSDYVGNRTRKEVTF